VDPSYQGGGAGEYRYYNETIGQYKCYSAKCRAKMDCHSSNSETWTLLGIFKVDGISQSWIEQLPQNHTLGHWRWGDYSSFISAATEKLPNGCTKTKYKANGSYLYIDIKPEKNAKIDLAFYTNSICTILYKGKNDAFDLYDLIGTSYSDMVTFNSLLDGYKICQPCVTYSLKNNWTTQMIFNVTKNHSYHIYYKNHSNPFYFGNYSHYARYNKINQVSYVFFLHFVIYYKHLILLVQLIYLFFLKCQKFAINAQSSAATPQEISLAYRQHGMLQIGNLNYEADMISFKRLEADLPYDIVNNIPLSLQFAIIFFLGSLIFFCTSPNVLSPEGVIAKKFAIFESDGRVGALFYKLFSNQNGEECLPSDLGMRKENSLSVNTGGEACTQPNGKTEIISRGDGAKKTPLLWSKEGTGAQPILLPRLDGEPIANQVSNINGEEYFTRGGDMSKKTKTSASVNIEGATCTQLSKPRNKQKIESRGNATKKTPLSRSKEGKGALPLSLPKPEGTLSADQFSKLNSTVNFSIGEDMSKRTSLSMNNVAARSTQLSESNHKPKIVSRGDTETKTMVLGSSNSTVTLMRSLPRPEGTPIDNVTKETPLVVSDRREGATSLSTQKFKQKKVFRLLSKLAKHAKFSSRGDDSSSTAR
jgi:hypothetical protein